MDSRSCVASSHPFNCHVERAASFFVLLSRRRTAAIGKVRQSQKIEILIAVTMGAGLQKWRLLPLSLTRPLDSLVRACEERYARYFAYDGRIQYSVEMHSRGRMIGRLLEKSLAFVPIRQSVCAHAYPRGRAEGERLPLMSPDHSFDFPHLRGRAETRVEF